MASLPPSAEWHHFASLGYMIDPATPTRDVSQIDYPNRHDPQTVPVWQGILERQKKFLKNWTSGECDAVHYELLLTTMLPATFIVTPCGYLHEFTSSTPSSSPTHSTYLPHTVVIKSVKHDFEFNLEATVAGSGEKPRTYRGKSQSDVDHWYGIFEAVSRRLVPMTGSRLTWLIAGIWKEARRGRIPRGRSSRPRTRSRHRTHRSRRTPPPRPRSPQHGGIHDRRAVPHVRLDLGLDQSIHLCPSVSRRRGRRPVHPSCTRRTRLSHHRRIFFHGSYTPPSFGTFIARRRSVSIPIRISPTSSEGRTDFPCRTYVSCRPYLSRCTQPSYTSVRGSDVCIREWSVEEEVDFQYAQEELASNVPRLARVMRSEMNSCNMQMKT
jgi:hypothetical protein